MVKIRLARIGTNKKPFYRIVVMDGDTPRDGRQIELIGHYDPKKGQKSAVIKADRVQHWLKSGAQPTEPVRQLLKKLKLTAAKAA